MSWTLDQVIAHQARVGAHLKAAAYPLANPLANIPQNITKPTFRVAPTTDVAKLNKTEAAFLAYVKPLCEWVEPHAITLKLGHDTRYTPDFAAVRDLQFIFYETKGFMRDDARAKLFMAARLFRWAKFVLVRRVKTTWEFEEVKA